MNYLELPENFEQNILIENVVIYPDYKIGVEENILNILEKKKNIKIVIKGKLSLFGIEVNHLYEMFFTSCDDINTIKNRYNVCVNIVKSNCIEKMVNIININNFIYELLNKNS